MEQWGLPVFTLPSLLTAVADTGASAADYLNVCHQITFSQTVIAFAVHTTPPYSLSEFLIEMSVKYKRFNYNIVVSF